MDVCMCVWWMCVWWMCVCVCVWVCVCVCDECVNGWRYVYIWKGKWMEVSLNFKKNEYEKYSTKYNPCYLTQPLSANLWIQLKPLYRLSTGLNVSVRWEIIQSFCHSAYVNLSLSTPFYQWQYRAITVFQVKLVIVLYLNTGWHPSLSAIIT